MPTARNVQRRDSLPLAYVSPLAAEMHALSSPPVPPVPSRALAQIQAPSVPETHPYIHKRHINMLVNTNIHATILPGGQSSTTYRTNLVARLVCRSGRHGDGICKARPLTLYFFSSTSGFAFSSARFTNSAGRSTPWSRRRIAKQSSTIRSAACFFPCFMIMRTSFEIKGSLVYRDILEFDSGTSTRRLFRGLRGLRKIEASRNVICSSAKCSRCKGLLLPRKSPPLQYCGQKNHASRLETQPAKYIAPRMRRSRTRETRDAIPNFRQVFFCPN